LAASHPPDLQFHALHKRPSWGASLGHLERCEARQPAHRHTTGNLRTPGTLKRHALFETAGDEQLVHFLMAQQNGAIVIGEPRGVAQGSGDGRHQPRHRNRHDERGDHYLEQRKAALLHCGGASKRGTPVMGSTRTTR